MTTASILQETTRAKVAHARWVKRAEHLISGLPIEKDFIPLEATTCVFGQWFYSQGTRLRSIEKIAPIFDKIEKQHDKIHDIYGEIYKIYFVIPEKRGLLDRLLTFNSKEPTATQKEEAKVKYKLLKEISHTLILHIEELEKEAKTLNYEELGM